MPQIGNMMNPYTPNFEPPEPFQPPRVDSYAREFKGTVFEQAQAATAHAQNEFHRHIAQVNKDRRHYTDEGYNAQIGAFTTTGAYQAIDRHVQQVRARRDQAEANVAKIRGSLSPDGDTAAELRATRYWTRTKAMLDVADKGAVISKSRELISNAEPAELGTLLQELDAYIAARGLPTDWIDRTLGQSVPEYGHAATQLDKAKQAVIITERNAHRLQQAITRGDQVPIPLSTPKRAGDYDPDK